MEIRMTTAVLFTILILLLVAVSDGRPAIKPEPKTQQQQCIEKVRLGLKACMNGASPTEKAGCAVESKRQLETRCDVHQEFSRRLTDEIMKQLFEMEV